jgi:iron complex outermembrane receptor protein
LTTTTLGAEESESTSIGVVWNIIDNFDLTFDYWQLDTTNLIQQMDEDEILYIQAKLNEAGQGGSVSDIYPGASVSFLGNGRIDYVVAPTDNIGLTERKGIDVSFNAQFETKFGDFGASVNASKFLTYKDSYFDNGSIAISKNRLGDENYPDLRVNITLDWNIDDHSLTYFGSSISKQVTDAYTDDTKTDFYEIEAMLTHNISYSYSTPWSSNVSIGVNNFTNEEPKFDKYGGYNSSLYNPYGRTYYVTFSQSF